MGSLSPGDPLCFVAISHTKSPELSSSVVWAGLSAFSVSVALGSTLVVHGMGSPQRRGLGELAAALAALRRGHLLDEGRVSPDNSRGGIRPHVSWQQGEDYHAQGWGGRRGWPECPAKGLVVLLQVMGRR